MKPRSIFLSICVSIFLSISPLFCDRSFLLFR